MYTKDPRTHSSPSPSRDRETKTTTPSQHASYELAKIQRGAIEETLLGRSVTGNVRILIEQFAGSLDELAVTLARVNRGWRQRFKRMQPIAMKLNVDKLGVEFWKDYGAAMARFAIWGRSVKRVTLTSLTPMSASDSKAIREFRRFDHWQLFWSQFPVLTNLEVQLICISVKHLPDLPASLTRLSVSHLTADFPASRNQSLGHVTTDFIRFGQSHPELDDLDVGYFQRENIDGLLPKGTIAKAFQRTEEQEQRPWKRFSFTGAVADLTDMATIFSPFLTHLNILADEEAFSPETDRNSLDVLWEKSPDLTNVQIFDLRRDTVERLYSRFIELKPECAKRLRILRLGYVYHLPLAIVAQLHTLCRRLQEWPSWYWNDEDVDANDLYTAITSADDDSITDFRMEGELSSLQAYWPLINKLLEKQTRLESFTYRRLQAPEFDFPAILSKPLLSLFRVEHMPTDSKLVDLVMRSSVQYISVLNGAYFDDTKMQWTESRPIPTVSVDIQSLAQGSAVVLEIHEWVRLDGFEADTFWDAIVTRSQRGDVRGVQLKVTPELDMQITKRFHEREAELRPKVRFFHKKAACELRVCKRMPE